MAAAIPSIACIGIIGRNNNPLHTSIFPSYDSVTKTARPLRTPLQFSLLLSSTLDVFAQRGGSVSGDVGLLHAIDDRLAAYGFETNTGVRMVVVVDMRGRRAAGADDAAVRHVELKPVFRAMQAAYVRLLQNPFFEPDEHAPLGGGGRGIASRRFKEEMRRIGETWTPGVTSL